MQAQSSQQDQPVPIPRIRLISVTQATGWGYLTTDAISVAAEGALPLPISVAIVDQQDRVIAQHRVEQSLAAVSESEQGPFLAKVGFMPSESVVGSVRNYFQERPPSAVVVDPELADRSGRTRVSERAVEAVRTGLLGNAYLVVVNAAEAELITRRPAQSPSRMRDACKAIFDLGPERVVVTGGHLDGFPIDYLYDGTGFEELGADRIVVDGQLKGAGALFSGLATARIARGIDVLDAVHWAKQRVSVGIKDRVFQGDSTAFRADGSTIRIPSRGSWTPDIWKAVAS